MGYSLSLCIPTNGIVEWVVPVLDSIIAQKADPDKYEIVITDNGTNEIFESVIYDYKTRYPNIVYAKNEASGFYNQIESFKLASGEFIKFLNHRMLMDDNSLDYFINFSEQNSRETPIVYFLNGRLSLPERSYYSTFDDYVKNLSYYSSWSAGLGLWKKHREILLNKSKYNRLFPHTDILFGLRNRSSYLIDNKKLLSEISDSQIKKGNYNLFYAFSVIYPSILAGLLADEAISPNTFFLVMEDNKSFITNLYKEYIIDKVPCSYDLTNYKEYMDVYYQFGEIERKALKMKLENGMSKFFKRR